jgi:site-specific recombinase XerD
MHPLTEAFVSMQASTDTQKAYRKDIARWDEAGLPLTVEGVTQWREQLVTKHASSTAARYWSTVRTFHRWLVQVGALQHSPFEMVKAPALRPSVVVNVPSDADVECLRANLTTPRNRLIVELLLMGLRASEVVNLRADALRFDPGYGHYLVFRGKGDKERIVPVAESVIDAINATDYESEWMVANDDGSQVTYDTVNGVVDTAAAKAGVTIYPHMLRHHYATRLVRAGANIFSLQKLVGHASVVTTQRYTHMDLSDLVEAAALDPRRNGGIRVVEPYLQADPSPREDAGRGPAAVVASAAVR